MKKYLIAIAVLVMVVGCGEKNQDEDIAHKVKSEEMVFIETSNLNPCDAEHEIEILREWHPMTPTIPSLTVDWGSENCRFIELNGLKIFNDSRPVEIGFCSDGILVWRYQPPPTSE